MNWAGGKTQLLAEIEKNLPNSTIDTYVEPFIGGGAVLFWILDKFVQLKKAIVNDINQDLINTYKTIQSTPKEIISILEILQNEYHSLENAKDKQQAYYYQKRELFNNKKQEKLIHSALFIFLNRTCFNGLYRVNRKNKFNVPIGSYRKPTICDKSNIWAVSEALQKVELICGDFEQTVNYADSNSLFYLDPPYKPLSETSNFNSYAKDKFDDNEQIRLKKFCEKLNLLGHNWILSNSDVKAKNATNNFFDDLYADFVIKRVNAKRYINANSEKRGFIKELLITN